MFEAGITVWTRIRLVFFVFRVSSKKLWCTTQNDRPTLIKWNSRHMTSFFRKNRRPLLFFVFCKFYKSVKLLFFKVLLPQTTSFGFGTIVVLFRSHTPRIVIHHLWRSYQDHINVLWSTTSVFAQHFFAPIVRSLFFERLQDPARTNLFSGQVFMEYRI